MQKDFYTAGELARLTGVSYKTIRHYNKVGLVKPEKYTESGYQQYGMKSLEILQRILMLKYLDFSLDEIQKILSEENIADTFLKQERMLQAQKEHISQVLEAVKEMQGLEEMQRWDKMLQIIHMTRQKEEVNKQYTESGNLQKRINIHVYSTSKTNWYQWIFEGLQLEKGMKILEVGCGNGMLWSMIHAQLPDDMKIYLTDNSERMLQAARKKIEKDAAFYKKKNIEFVYLQKDAERFGVIEGSFDRIIANHMLYHISNDSRKELLENCKDMLRAGGMFYASTVGQTHLKELYTLVKGFDEQIDLPAWMTKNFELENGMEQLQKVFAKVTVSEQQNDLLVPSAQAIYDYIDSWPGNAKEKIESRKREWMNYLKEKVSEDNPYFIHKSAGAFKAFKE